MPNKNKNDTMYRELKLDRAAVKKDERTVKLSFSSETPYKRWFGLEILSHDAEAIDLSRLQEIGVLLFNHDSNMPIGQVLDVSLDETNKKCNATVKFDADEDAEKIYQKVLSGTLKGVSVGYRVGVWEEVGTNEISTNGRFQGPCEVATKWMPYEISIVSVPADASVGVGRSMKTEGENRNMPPKENEQVPAPDNVPAPTENQNKSFDNNQAANQMPPVSQEDVQRAIIADRQRTADINSMCRAFGVEPDEYIANGSSADQVRKIIFDMQVERNQPTKVSVGKEDVEKFRSAVVDGLSMRAGINIEKPAEGYRDFRGLSLVRIAQECIERDTGKDMRYADRDELVREALTGAGAFTGILSNVANKSMAQAYQTAPTTFQLWTAKGSNSDFKTATRYRLSEADTLEKIGDSGEFKDSKVSESSITTTVGTYGRSFTLSRKAIINDDLNALSQIPAKYGAAARRMINSMVYAILTDNPTIESAALFSSGHGTLGTAAITVAGLGAAKAAMAKQTNIGGKEKLNIQPANLIVPVDLEVTAAQLISSTVDPTKSNATPNPFANKLNVVADPALEDTSAWYLAAAPGICPCVEVTYLNGQEQPKIESMQLFNALGVKYRVYLDFGVNLIDFRGLYKSDGTAS